MTFDEVPDRNGLLVTVVGIHGGQAGNFVLLRVLRVVLELGEMIAGLRIEGTRVLC